MTDQPTRPLTEPPYTDRELALLGELVANGCFDNEYKGVKGLYEAVMYERAEVSRLRAENTAQARQLDAVREIKPQRRNSVFVSSEQLAMMHGWNDAVDAIRAAVNPCECGMTDPSTWTTYGGLTEPGSAYEWNPDCPAHGDPTVRALGLDQNEEGQANG